MNLLDPVKWGAQAALSVTTTAVKLGINVVRTAEVLLGRADGDDTRYEPVAETPQGTPPRSTGYAPPAERFAETPAPTIPRGERRMRDVEPTPRSDLAARRVGGNGSTTVVESEGAADPGATIAVEEPWDGYDEMTAADIAKRLRKADTATKAVVRLYERANKQRKSVLAATG